MEVVDGSVDIKVPSGCQPGTVLRIRGKGAPQLNNASVRILILFGFALASVFPVDRPAPLQGEREGRQTGDKHSKNGVRILGGKVVLFFV